MHFAANGAEHSADPSAPLNLVHLLSKRHRTHFLLHLPVPRRLQGTGCCTAAACSYLAAAGAPDMY